MNATVVIVTKDRRNPLRVWVYGPRNDILFAWHVNGFYRELEAKGQMRLKEAAAR